MSILDMKLAEKKSVVILGHIRPDGDCVGSCLGLYNYLEEVYPELSVTLCLEAPSEKFSYLKNFDRIQTEFPKDQVFDLCICLDSSDRERLGEGQAILAAARDSLCVDHHITNMAYAAENVVNADSSSTSEMIYELLDESRISKAVAECIYTGIIHDTGVFKYSCTSKRTMEIAGTLMSTGIDFPSIIDGSFYRKTYVQNQILGRALMESVVFMHGTCIFSVVRQKDMDFYGVTSKDMDGVIDQLRVTKGVECAIFMYETDVQQQYKVSLRSNRFVDVSKVAGYFGGGGHVRAAGCTMSGSIYDVINNLSGHIEEQMPQEAFQQMTENDEEKTPCTMES